MREAVSRHYPETEAQLPDEKKEGQIPPSVLETLQGPIEACEQRVRKKPRLIDVKNATPGHGAKDIEQCLEDVRPHAITFDKGAAAYSDPATLREKAVERYGEMHVKTGIRMIEGFHPKYTSQVGIVVPHTSRSAS